MSGGKFTERLEILGETEDIPYIVPDKREYGRRFDRHYTILFIKASKVNKTLLLLCNKTESLKDQQ